MLMTIPDDVRPHTAVIAETDEWLIGAPLSPYAMFWWGAFTDWCTALDAGMFNDYTAKGVLIVFKDRTTSYRWMLQPSTGEFRDRDNKRASWRGFLMRHPELAGALLERLASLAEATRQA